MPGLFVREYSAEDGDGSNYACSSLEEGKEKACRGLWWIGRV